MEVCQRRRSNMFVYYSCSQNATTEPTSVTHDSTDTIPRTFKVNGSKVNVTALHQKRYNLGTDKFSTVELLVKIIPQPSATCNAMFKVIRSNTDIAITPPRIARLRSNLVYRVSSRHRRYTANVEGQRSKVKVTAKIMYQQQKGYNTAMDRFGDFKLGITS